MGKALLSVLLFCATNAFAADSFEAPKLTGPIVDEAGLISHDQYAELSRELRALSDSGKAQVAVLVTRSLQGLDIAEFGIRLAEAWKIGTKSKDRLDRGVIFIVAPNDRRMRIEVGYGLEGEIPDAVASQILERIVKPRFRENRMSDGIYAGTKALIGLARGEGAASGISGEDAATAPAKGRPSLTGALVILVVLFLIGIFRRFPFAIGAGLPFGILFFSSIFAGLGIALVLNLLSRIFFRDKIGAKRHGLFDGLGGGGFSGGGGYSGGGGFSGGGGSFGGGGASSDW